ncbi:MAG: hypothetical protein LAT57_02375 [Balneolales bacterium]|nr:hypothetical protein [Balneolales bacterium]
MIKLLVLSLVAGGFFWPPAARALFSTSGDTLVSESPQHGLFPALGFTGEPNQASIRLMAEGGSFYTVQQPESSFRGGFNAIGSQQKGSWLLLGAMDVSQQQDAAITWVAQSPMVLNQPYQWADSSSADWTRRRVGLQGALLSPKFYRNNVRGGIQIRHLVEQGSTRQDPRPLYRHTRYGLRAGLVATPSERSTYGWYIGYSSGNEESEIGYYSRTNPRVFYIRGLATMSVANVVRATRTWYEKAYETGLYWQGNSAMASLDVRFRDQDNQDGTANPVFAGGYTLTEAVFHLKFDIPFESRVKLTSTFNYGEGTDPLFRQVNIHTTGLQNSLELGRSSTSRSVVEYIGLKLGHNYLFHEDIVGFASYEIQHIHYGARVIATIQNAKGRPSLEARISGSEKIQGEYIRERPALVTSQITDPQVEYLMASYIALSIQAGYTVHVGSLPFRIVSGGSFVMVTRSDGVLSGTSRALLHTDLIIPF